MRLHGDREHPPDLGTLHRAHGILTEIPEHLLDLVAISHRPSLSGGKPARDRDAGFFRRHAMIHERERVFHKLNQVNFVEVILFGA